MPILRQCARYLRTLRTYTKRFEYPASRTSFARRRGYYITLPRLCSTGADSPVIFPKFENDQALSPAEVQERFLILSGDFEKKRVRCKDLLYILKNASKHLKKLDEVTSLLLLRSCGDVLPDVKPEVRHALTLMAWNLVQEKTDKLTLDIHNTLLEVVVTNGQPTFDPFLFLKTITVKPNLQTYHHLLMIAANSKDERNVTKVMDVMKENDMETITVPVYNALIHCSTVNNNLDNTLVYMGIMKSQVLEPNEDTYVILANGFARRGNLENLSTLLSSYNLSIEQILNIIKLLSQNSFGNHISKVLKFLPESMNPESFAVMNTVVELTTMGYAEDAFEIISYISRNSTNNLQYDYFLHEMFHISTPVETIVKIVCKLAELKENTIVFTDILKLALESKIGCLAFLIFEKMKEKNVIIRPHYYWPLFRIESKMQENEVLSILNHMASMNVTPDYDTLCEYVVPSLNLLEPHMTLRKIKHYGKSDTTLTAIISVLLAKGKFLSVLNLCEKLKIRNIISEKLIQPLLEGYDKYKEIKYCIDIMKLFESDTELPGMFLLQLVISRIKDNIDHNDIVLEVKLFVQIFKEQGCAVSQSVANKIVVELYKQNTHTSDKYEMIQLLNKAIQNNLVPSPEKPRHARVHPKDMTEVELEYHLAFLKSNNMNTRGILRKLLLSYCKNNKLEKAEEIKDEMDNLGLDWTAGMTALLFDLYVKNGRLLKAQAQLGILKTKYTSFELDGFKVVNFAIKLVEDNQFDTAVDVLSNHNSNREIKDIFSHNCVMLLKAVSVSSHGERTEEILDLLIKNKYCRMQNFFLGPVINSYLLNGDLVNGFKTFKRFAQEYKSTPYHQELLTCLCKNEKYWNEVQEVHDILTNEHGRLMADVSLIVALARTGSEEYLTQTLKRMAMSSSLSTKEFAVTLQDTLKYLRTEEKLSTIRNIVYTCIKSTYTDIGPICSSMLTICNEVGDCKYAIELFEKMLCNNIEMTEGFHKKFRCILEAHNVDLPPEFIAFSGMSKI